MGHVSQILVVQQGHTQTKLIISALLAYFHALPVPQRLFAPLAKQTTPLLLLTIAAVQAVQVDRRLP